jgi:hypothetical protein
MSEIKKEYDKVVSKIDKSQLKNSANSVDMTREKEDLTPNNFTQNMKEHHDQRDGIIVRSKPEFEKYAEAARFNKSYKTKIEKE